GGGGAGYGAVGAGRVHAGTAGADVDGAGIGVIAIGGDGAGRASRNRLVGATVHAAAGVHGTRVVIVAEARAVVFLPVAVVVDTVAHIVPERGARLEGERVRGSTRRLVDEVGDPAAGGSTCPLCAE